MSKPWSEIKHKRDDRTQKELAADGQKSEQQYRAGLASLRPGQALPVEDLTEAGIRKAVEELGAYDVAHNSQRSVNPDEGLIDGAIYADKDTQLRFRLTRCLRSGWVMSVPGHTYRATVGYPADEIRLALKTHYDIVDVFAEEMAKKAPVATDAKSVPDLFPGVDVQPGDWLNSLTSAQRKGIPMARGVLDYFPDALAAVARHSQQGNDKHNPGQPLHWSREKSSDHADCILRHLAGRGGRDSADGSRHSVGLAWRALALLQLEIESAVRRGEEV